MTPIGKILWENLEKIMFRYMPVGVLYKISGKEIFFLCCFFGTFFIHFCIISKRSCNIFIVALALNWIPISDR